MALPHDDWDRHWDDYSEAAEDNPAQTYRRRLVLRRLGNSPRRVLDIGSGQGDLACAIVKRFPDAQVVGLEVSRSGVSASSRKVPAGVFLQRDLLDETQPPGPYEGWATHATCSEVLEHVDDPVLLLRQGRRYMAPGSRLVVTVPAGPMSAFDRHIGHRMHYTTAALRTVLESAGFMVEDVARAGFPFFNLYRLAVVLRGERLIAEVSAARDGGASPVARLAMKAFRGLFVFNVGSTPLGWQLVATARALESS